MLTRLATGLSITQIPLRGKRVVYCCFVIQWSMSMASPFIFEWWVVRTDHHTTPELSSKHNSGVVRVVLKANFQSVQPLCHKQLVVSIPKLSAPSCHLLGKINAVGTFFSMIYLWFPSWSAILTINTDGAENLGVERTRHLEIVS